MKENEAPEKLYFGEVDKGILNIYSNRESNDEIEYTRTDAFIEKATLWLLTNASDYCILHNSYDTQELVKDFVEAMKRD